ncbi:hypothetical protein [Luteibacter aegosomatissinici]|uniref:hypothetical protein n=1 Tax=Luteibacter aegosomatissinici TaxID=2911539 RepID=UPI001FF7A69F|nr:hypothetical protein [Luteibacter aegosomatissinici]UPG92861.1 hypothetical protein L2Y97_13400 [Luteibacter aegosomatissinici]
MGYGTIEEATEELLLGRWCVTPTPQVEQEAWGLWTIEPAEGGYRISASTVDEVWEFWMMCYRAHLVAEQSTAVVLALHARDEAGMAARIEEWASGVVATPPAQVESALRAALPGFRAPGPWWRQEVKSLGAVRRPDEHDLRTSVQLALIRQLHDRLTAASDSRGPASPGRRL